MSNDNSQNKMLIPTNVLVDVLKYLVQRPYSEVFKLVQSIEKNAVPHSDSEQK